MIKRLLYVCRVLFVSKEFLSFMVIILLVFLFPERIHDCAKMIKTNLKQFEFILFLPPTLLGFFFKDSRAFLFPTKDKGSLLQKLPVYADLKIHFWVNFFYLFLYSVIAIFIGILGADIKDVNIFGALLISLIGSMISYFDFWKAQIDLDEILIQIESKKPRALIE